jgi:hypothetical protein
VDILIAWYIEPLPTDRILEYTAQALHKFRPFWIEQIEITTLNFLEHFIEDADNYAQVKSDHNYLFCIGYFLFLAIRT